MILQQEKHQESPRVQTRKGWIEGTEAQGVFQFLGIPYAQAKERFVPAEPVQAWEGYSKRIITERSPIRERFLA